MSDNLWAYRHGTFEALVPPPVRDSSVLYNPLAVRNDSGAFSAAVGDNSFKRARGSSGGSFGVASGGGNRRPVSDGGAGIGDGGKAKQQRAARSDGASGATSLSMV